MATIGQLSCSNFTQTNPLNSVSIYPSKYSQLIAAVNSENLRQIERIINADKLNLNYADPVYGVSLLNWCIFNKKEESFKKLLELGASPNWQDSACQFSPPITEAARLDYTSEFLKLALNHEGNPDVLSKRMQGSDQQTPLFGAIYSTRMDNVILLVSKGADINLTQDSLWTPLAEALLHEKTEIAKYLLENGANFTSLRFKTNLGEELNILDFLRQMQFPLTSSRYKTKREVIDFLQGKKLNYWTYPIPEKIKQTNKFDTEYLSKY